MLFVFLSGYNDMKTELKDFLQRFAAEGKVGQKPDFVSSLFLFFLSVFSSSSFKQVRSWLHSLVYSQGRQPFFF